MAGTLGSSEKERQSPPFGSFGQSVWHSEWPIVMRIGWTVIGIAVILATYVATSARPPIAPVPRDGPSERDGSIADASSKSIVSPVQGSELTTRRSHASGFKQDGDGRTLILDRGNFRAYEVRSGCPGTECETDTVYDNPYEPLAMTDLAVLAVQDSTAAFQFAVRRFAEAVTPAEIAEARKYGLRSVALAASEDAAWMYNALVEHLDLYFKTDPNVSDEWVRESYVWMHAGHLLGLVEPQYRDKARELAIRREDDLELLDEQAVALANELHTLRLQLTGESLAMYGR
jgi:hypothetical protein